MIVASRIPVSQYKSGDLIARLHDGKTGGGPVVYVEAVQSAFTEDRPDVTFSGGQVVAQTEFGGGAFTALPWCNIAALDDAPLGSYLNIRITASQTSTGTFTATFSADLVLRET
jgi:hypothetical protein